MLYALILFGSITLRIPLGSEPPTLDPNLATDSVSFRVITNLQAGLTKFTNEMDVVPNIAESWEFQGRSIIFRIRDDALWSDGEPVTSYDFLYSWTRLLNPKTGAEYAYFLYDIEGAYEFNTGKVKFLKGITAPDMKTLIVTLKRPVVYFPAIVSFMVTYPVRKDVIERWGPAWTESKHIVCSGPFTLKEWRHDYKLVLEPNPYWFGENKVRRVEFFIVQDPSVSLSLYKFGFLDMTSLFSLAIAKYRGREDFVKVQAFTGHYIAFNIRKIKDVNLRRALAHAIPRSKIVKVLGGVDTPATSWIPPGLLGHSPKIGLGFNPEETREYLRKAKIPKKLSLYFNASPENKKIAEVLKEVWRKYLGLNVELESMEWKMYLSMLAADPPALFRLGWSADFPDPHNFMDIFTSNSGNNHTGFASQEYDVVILEASEETEPEKRKELYEKAQRILLENEVVIIPLFWSTQNALIRANIKLNPLGILYLNEINH